MYKKTLAQVKAGQGYSALWIQPEEGYKPAYKGDVADHRSRPGVIG